MHWLDIAILIVLGIGAALGFCSGLLWQVARVVGLSLSLYLAITTNAALTEWLGQQWPDSSPLLCRCVAFAAVFLLVYAVLYWTTRLLHQAIKASKLETLDRFLGALLGMAKMAAIVSVACAGLAAVALPLTQEWMEQATLAPHFAHGTAAMMKLIPQRYRDELGENFQQAREQLQKKGLDAAVDKMR